MQTVLKLHDNEMKKSGSNCRYKTHTFLYENASRVQWLGVKDEGVGNNAAEGTLRVTRASILGAIDHNLSVDPCGFGA